MNETLQRKGIVGTIGEAIEWLQRNPVLIVVFLFYGLLELFAELLGPIGTLISILSFLVLIYIDGLVHVVARDEAVGEGGDLGHASSVVLGRLLSLVGIWIAYLVAITVGLILLVLPGIYLAVRLSLAFPACVIDDRDALESLKTSWSVAKGNLLKLFGITVLSLLVIASAGIATALFTGIGEEFMLAYLAVGALVGAVLSPIVQFAYARVYLENRPAPETESADDDDNQWGSTADEAQW
jgi:hypothetical protein